MFYTSSITLSALTVAAPKLTKPQLAKRIRENLATAKALRASNRPFLADAYSWLAAKGVKELRTRIYADRLTALIVAFPRCVTYHTTF